jgi:rubrerythrin
MTNDLSGVIDEAIGDAERSVNADGETPPPEEVVRRALVALATAEETEAATAEEVAELRAVVNSLGETTDQLETAVESLSTEVETLETEVDEDVEDLRERLVRLYRDAEQKAEADHTHPDLAERLDEVDANARAVADRLDGLEDRVESIDDTVAGIEDRLDALAAADDDAADKLSRVASAVVRTQRRLRAIEGERAADRLDDILDAANRNGVQTADCDGCGHTVRLSLLSSAECPHCESRFAGLDPADRFYRRSRLTVDDRPALSGDSAAVASGSDEGTDAADSRPTDRDAPGEGIDR